MGKCRATHQSTYMNFNIYLCTYTYAHTQKAVYEKNKTEKERGRKEERGT